MENCKIKINDKSFSIERSPDGKTIFVNSKPYQVELIKSLSKDYFSFASNAKIMKVGFQPTENNNLKVYVDNIETEVELMNKTKEMINKLGMNIGGSANSGIVQIKAPMPGLVVKILKTEGDLVEKNETLIIVEAMKMENSIKSNFKGKIISVKAKQGSPTNKNDVLFELEIL